MDGGEDKVALAYTDVRFAITDKKITQKTELFIREINMHNLIQGLC